MHYGLEAGVKVKQIQCAIGSLYNIAYDMKCTIARISASTVADHLEMLSDVPDLSPTLLRCNYSAA